MAVVAKNIWATIKVLLIEQYRGNLRSEIEAGTYTDKEGVVKHYSLPEGADNRFQGVLKSVVDVLMQPLDDSAVAVKNAANLETASGSWLDVIGKLFGLARYYMETDDSFRNRIKEEISDNNAGTPDNVIYNASMLSAHANPQYLDEAQATFLVYDGPCFDKDGNWADGGQKQLSRAQVKRMSPAGVLGLPAAAILLADGTLLASVGDDVTNESVLTEEGQQVLTEDGFDLLSENETSPELSHKIFLVGANDANIERDMVLVDGSGSTPLLTRNSELIRVTVKGNNRVPTMPTVIGNSTVNGVRIKDLPDAGEDNGFIVRDSEDGGTAKTRAYTEAEIEDLWDNTPADDSEEDDDNE